MPGSLTHSPADIVGRLLVGLGLGADPGGTWPVHHSEEPNSPDNVITIIDQAGADNPRFMIDGSLQSYEGVNIRVRAKTHAVGWTKADTIRNTIAESVYLDTLTIDGTTYTVHAFVNIGPVLALGKESPQSMRRVFVINSDVILEES